jgi:hypothetical protein
MPRVDFFEVYGLRDWSPCAIACGACKDHVLSTVHGAGANPALDAPSSCELAYEGICLDRGEER